MISATYIQVGNCACFYDVTFWSEIKDIVLNNYHSSCFYSLPRSPIDNIIGGLSEIRLCVFLELCAASLLVVSESPSVLL